MRWFKRNGRALVNAALAVLIVALYITTTTPVAQSAVSELYNSPIYRGQREGVIGLECAVSWDAEALPAILTVLREKNARITFLVSGDFAADNPNIIAELLRDGHELGTMGSTPFFDGNRKAVTADIERSLATIQRVSGIRPVLYYSGTRDTAISAKAAAWLHITHILCTVDLLSARGDAQDILTRALDQPFDGSILLLQPTAQALRALPAILDGLREQGFTVAPVSETLKK